jgi:hypothetical protein
MAGPTDVVIAGTKAFALALFAPVTERAGTRPRIAPDPAATLTLCGAATGVLLVEYGPGWLPVLAQLRQQHPGLRMVAALPPGQEGAALSLVPLAVESVPWTGAAASVVPALERALAASSPGAAPAVPAVSAPPPAEAPVLDLFGDMGAVAATPLPDTLPAAPAVSGPAPAPGEPALDLFNDLGATAVTPAPAGGAPQGRAERSGPAAWPATGPDAAEAEQLLREVLAGTPSLSPLRSVVEQVAAGLSPLERQAFTADGSPVDAEVIRRAAVLRLRTAAAMADRPPPGTPIDGAAVAELLSEIDGLLGAVKGLLDEAPLGAQVSLEAIRNALVKEAVDFSEACHAMGGVEAPAAAAPQRITGRAAAARVLSVNAGVDAEDRPQERRRRLGPLVTLVVVLATGAAFHAWNLFTAPPRQPPATFEGAPAGTMAIQSGKSYFLVALPGQKVNGADLEAYRQREARRGNQVREVGPGTWSIEPASAGSGGSP